ncbi:MAG: hypothetical protein ACKVU4_07815 [Phycisphaerales bacterium]
MDDQLIGRLLDKDVLIFLVMGTIGIVAIVFSTVSGMVRSTAREKSRREIAAYIAEGSMTPEQGEKLMAAGIKKEC